MQRYFESVKYLQSFICMLLFSSIIFALPVMGGIKIDLPDTSLAAIITRQINTHKSQLSYPLSVTRFYKLSGFRFTWIAPNMDKTHTSDAMMLLDCVVQYGLNHADYHPLELQYDKLNELINYPEKNSIAEKALFDIFLTDAIITFINNLHYGKLNPVFTAVKIDVAKGLRFNTESTLINAVRSTHFDEIITDVQPTSAEYKNLKYEMYLVTGLYILDCYETPEAEIRKMAINMERLRWIENNEQPYILFNTANGNLRLHEKDDAHLFKGTVKMYFAPDRHSFKMDFFTIKPNGRILAGRELLELPKKLAETILAYDNNKFNKKALNITRNRKIRLGVSIMVNSVYLTCEVIDGTRIFYKDLLKLDKKLAFDLYGSGLELAAGHN